jgi:hypothetical protein
MMPLKFSGPFLFQTAVSRTISESKAAYVIFRGVRQQSPDNQPELSRGAVLCFLHHDDDMKLQLMKILT